MDSLIELKEHEDLSLADEADRNWTEVLDQTYIFNRKRREVNKTHIVYSICELYTGLPEPKISLPSATARLTVISNDFFSLLF